MRFSETVNSYRKTLLRTDGKATFAQEGFGIYIAPTKRAEAFGRIDRVSDGHYVVE